MALGMTKPVLQVAGYQNSGKTTLIEKLTSHLAKDGIRVGVIKHHGHGGRPDTADAVKDTGKYREAGAVVTGVEGAGMLQLHAENHEGWNLDELLKVYDVLPVDLILVEGFKKADLPKVVILRSAEDMDLLEELSTIQFGLTWFEMGANTELSFPIFHIREESAYLSLLSQELKRRIQ